MQDVDDIALLIQDGAVMILLCYYNIKTAMTLLFYFVTTGL